MLLQWCQNRVENHVDKFDVKPKFPRNLHKVFGTEGRFAQLLRALTAAVASLSIEFETSLFILFLQAWKSGKVHFTVP